MKKFGENEILILLGAGASCDAGIKNSAQMITEIESKLQNDENWQQFKRLYQYIKSVHHQKEIFKGNFNPSEIFNIEQLVSHLDIIIRIANSEIDTYIFVGSWEKDLQPILDRERNASFVSSFKDLIINELTGEWLTPPNWIPKSSYFKSLIEFKNEYDGFPLKIFSLNYDLCVEQNLKSENCEFGFDENDSWSFRRYDYNDQNSAISYYLYKLHGSLNWKQKNEESLIRTEGNINPNELAIIFGTANKLQSYDPYLFYFYELREHCLKANLIICSGYSFFDEHINDVLKQGLKNNHSKKIAVNIYESKKDDDKLIEDICKRLSIEPTQVLLFNKPAKDFFGKDLNLETFLPHFDTKKDDELPMNF